MKLTYKTPFFAALAGLTLLACSAASSDEDIAQSDDDLTAEEIAIGASWNGVETEAADESTSTPFDVEEGAIVAPDPLANLDEPTDELKCNTAAGYKHGVKTTICVTTVDGKPVEVATASAFLKMRAAAAKVGVHIHIVSGFRTMAQQRHLYDLYKHHGGNLAAPPGYSNHQSGHALDLNTSGAGVYSWLAKHGSAYGFRRTVPSEKWHWEH